MKKLALVLALMMVAVMSFAQGFRPPYIVADTAEKFKALVKTGDLVYVRSTHTLYELSIDVNYPKNMGYILGSASRWDYPYSSAAEVTTLTTSGAATVGTTLTAGTSISSPIVSATTTLTLPGSTTITKTSGNGNSATASHSFVVTDTLTIGRALTGSAATRGSSTFSTTDTRKAIYIAGATSSDYYIVRGIATDSHTRPVAGDLLNCIAVTDSLIVMRQAGTTSGQGFTYFRIK